MNIFIDESGSFANSPDRNSWNCIAAYLSPEIDRKPLRDALARLKRGAGVSTASEIKLGDLRESDYLAFLDNLNDLRGVLFGVATDAGLHSVADVIRHREGQSEKILEHKSKLVHESGRTSLQNLANSVRGLSPQLYVQLQCHIRLLSWIVHGGTLYFVQRLPRTLGSFRWRIDEKNSARPEFEKTLTRLAPAILQTISFREPIPILEGADYRAFHRFDHEDGAMAFLKDDYGIDAPSDDPQLDIGKLLRDDLKFEDSKLNLGVQVAGLLVSGIRRCLRNQFKDGAGVAQRLGRLMTEMPQRQSSLRLMSFSGSIQKADQNVTLVAQNMRKNCRPMIAR